MITLDWSLSERSLVLDDPLYTLGGLEIIGNDWKLVSEPRDLVLPFVASVALLEGVRTVLSGSMNSVWHFQPFEHFNFSICVGESITILHRASSYGPIAKDELVYATVVAEKEFYQKSGHLLHIISDKQVSRFLERRAQILSDCHECFSEGLDLGSW